MDLRRLSRGQSCPVAGPDGRVGIQIRDLDQTVIGNPAHDIIRLALSLATASLASPRPISEAPSGGIFILVRDCLLHLTTDPN